MNLHMTKLHETKRVLVCTHKNTGACTRGETRVSSESVAKSCSRSNKACGFVRHDPLGTIGEGAGTSCFPSFQLSVIINISKHQVTKRNYVSRYHTYLRINNKANHFRDYREMTKNRAKKFKIKVLKNWEPNLRVCMGNTRDSEISAGEAGITRRRTTIPPLRGVLP